MNASVASAAFGANAELGRYITQIRERAGLKQAELARKITWSQAVLSRVESGERPLASDELNTLLDAIATPEARELRENLQRLWVVLTRPPLDHPDYSLLWQAEEVAQQLVQLRERPDVRNAFERRLAAYVGELHQTVALLLKRDHHIAFVGSIGIGKSTTICRLTRLELADPAKGVSVPVLESGAGGITLCEVHLRVGPGYGLIIEPRSDDDIRNDVVDFAEHLLRPDAIPNSEPQPDADLQGISKELERAIRNMSGLKVRREKQPNGKTARRDEAKDLSRRTGNIRELVVDVLARMELHKRDRRDVWYDASSGKPPLEWLKDTFEEINNGRHPDFTLPKRIEVVVPEPLLGASDITVRLIDTKGIDRTAARPDLEVHLDDPHTIAVLCSGFNNAPAAEARLLLERARASGVRQLESRTALLVLPRPNEALAVKDEAGIRVATSVEGYELKGEQIELSLQPLGFQFSIGFFNAYEDDPAQLRAFLLDCVAAARETFRSRLREIITSARALLLNHEEEQTQEVIRHAATMLRTWAERNDPPELPNARIYDSLIEQLYGSHPSTIRATIRREGEWSHLSYSHHLGYGARRVAALALGGRVDAFADLCKTMLQNPDYTEAQNLVDQASRLLFASYDDLLRKIQLMGQTSFIEALRHDGDLWTRCMNEWGAGSGYRERVAEYNSEWFDRDPHRQLDGELRQLIMREWHETIEKVTSLFEAA